MPVRVTDSHGASATGSILIDVANVDPIFTPPTVDGRAYEGTPFTLTVRATDQAGAYDPLTYEFDFDNDGVYDASNATGVIEHSYPTTASTPSHPRHRRRRRRGDHQHGHQRAERRARDRLHRRQAGGCGGRLPPASDIVDPGDDTVSQIIVRWGDGEESAYPASAT